MLTWKELTQCLFLKEKYRTRKEIVFAVVKLNKEILQLVVRRTSFFQLKECSTLRSSTRTWETCCVLMEYPQMEVHPGVSLFFEVFHVPEFTVP